MKVRVNAMTKIRMSILLMIITLAFAPSVATKSPAFQTQSSLPIPSSESELLSVLKTLDTFIRSVHDQLHDIPAFNENQLFDDLASFKKQFDRETAKQALPSITGIAIFTETGGWSAWAGTIVDLPLDWMEYIVFSEAPDGLAVLYETPGKVSVVHLTKSDYRIAMTQISLIDRALEGSHPDILTMGRKHQKYAFRYLSPFESLPGILQLGFDLGQSNLPDFFLSIDDHTTSQLVYGLDYVPEWLFPLFDPHFFAGGFLGLHSAIMLLIAGLFVWILTYRLVPFKIGNYQKIFGVALIAVSALLTPFLVNRLVRSLITDTAFAWWPDFPVKQTLVLPLSALLLIGAWIRWLFFLLQTLLLSGSKSHTRYQKRRIPGWLCQVSAIVLLIPCLITQTGTAVRQNISSRLQNWINEREHLLPLALESNLKHLTTDDIHLHFDDDILHNGAAFQLWRTSDLHVFEADFAIQILDQNGFILEQFSPFFIPDALHPETLHQVIAADTKHLIISPQLHYHSIHSPLIGITAFETDQNSFGFLVIQIAIEPDAIKPLPHEWGNAIDIYVARHQDSSELHRNIPAVMQAGWLDTLPSNPKWTQDESERFEVLLYRLPYSDPTQPEVLVGLLPRIPFESHLAGVARLAILALCILMPGLAYQEIKHLIRARKEKTYGSFTRQLLGAFLLPALILPLIFAATLHRVIDDSETEFQKSQMKQLLHQTQTQLKAHVIELAKVQRSNVEYHFFDETIPDFLGVMSGSWLILDEFGQEAMSGTTSLSHDLPLESISRVFQDTYYRGRPIDEVIFQSVAPGELMAQVILAFPQFSALNSNNDIFQGTFVCEIPITNEIFSSLDEFSDLLITIYSRGSVAASNRPELFQTGLIENRFDASQYRALTFHKQDTLLEFDRTHNRFSITGTLHSEFSRVIGAITLSFIRFPFKAPQSKAHEWLFPTTVFLLISGILFSLYFGRRIARPVQILTDSAQKVSTGNFDVTVPEHGVGEIRLLTQTFNVMLHDLKTQRIDLQERHAFINALLAKMSSAILAVDDSGTILTWNGAFNDLFPTVDTEVENQKIDRVFIDIGIPELKTTFDDYVAGSPGDRHIFRFFKEGQIVFLAVTFAKLESPVGLAGTLIVMDNITDAVQSSKLQAYSEMAGRIAHEVKNPLTPIQLSIEHLRQAWEDGAADFPAIFNQCLSMVLDEVKSLEQISSEFSRFARFPKPSFQLNDIRSLITEVVAMYPATSTGTTFMVDLPADPLICRYDHDQIKRVLINLLQNALQAMDNTGVLTIKSVRNDNLIQTEVTDTGPGMDNETLMNLFEPYFSTKKEGAGLGLVITKAVIDAHDGIIQVSSVPGKGTTFTFSLAAVDQDNPIKTENGGSGAE